MAWGIVITAIAMVGMFGLVILSINDKETYTLGKR
jgi:hypothetical protein